MRAVKYLKAHANKEALKASASTVSGSKVYLGGRAYAKSAKKDVGFLGISLLTRPTVYHAAVKVVTSSGNVAAKGTGSLMHGVSLVAGTAGSGVAKGVGAASKKAGEKVQNASNTCSAHITESAVWVKENGKKASSVAHSVGVSPTVTKATTNTASTVLFLNLVEAASKGRLAPALMKIPVAGPYLAALSLGGAAAYQVIAFACALSSAFTLVARQDEALYVHRMPYGPSPDGLTDVEWNARCKAHEEAAKMFKAANKKRKAAPDVDIKVGDAVWAAAVDEAFATDGLNAHVAGMADGLVEAFVNDVWVDDQPLVDAVQAIQEAIIEAMRHEPEEAEDWGKASDLSAAQFSNLVGLSNLIVDEATSNANGVTASSNSNA